MTKQPFMAIEGWLVMTDPRDAPATNKRRRPYHTLLLREGKGEPWSIEFGDYDRKVVDQEMQDRKEAYDHTRKRKYQIITTGETEAEIRAAVAAINNSAEGPAK